MLRAEVRMEERMAELEREVASLRARLDALASGPRERCSLRVDRRCPVCDHRSVLCIDEIADQSGEGDALRFAPVIGPLGGRPMGRFVVFVCRQCGLAEWYVGRLGEISLTHPAVRVLEGPSEPRPTGPFR
jgi:hypothetical protein